MKTISGFKETSKKVEITMGGWDGTGYNGEGKTMKAWEHPMHPGKTFVCKWMACYKQYCFLGVNFDNKHEKSGLPTVNFWYSCDKSYVGK